MKTTLLNTAAFLATTLITSFGFAQQAMVQTDLSAVLGSTGTTSAFAPQVELKPGVYAIGDDNHKLTGTKYLIVDQYINNAKKGLALLIDQDDLRNKSQATGRLYMIRPIEEGTTLMLSPIEIGLSGQLEINSEINTSGESQVLTISQDPQAGKLNYPYIVKGHNGAIGGQILGMRAKSDQNPLFRPWPSHSVFNSETDSGKIVVQNKVLSLYDPRRMESQEFKLVPINGSLGKMAALVSTKLNTQAEGYRSKTAVKELAFFMNLDDCELFMIAKPNNIRPGEYVFSFYGPRQRTFMDYFRKGRLAPENN